MRTPKFRHPLRHMRFHRLRHWDDVLNFIADRATTLGATGAADTFTCDVVHATGVLTLAGNAVAGETVTIGSTVYTFDASVAAVAATGVLTLAGNAVADETVTIGSKVYTWKAVIEAVAATGVLTLAGNALDTETVTIGATTYTFQTVLVDAPNNVLIGATASDSIDNLVAAIVAGAGAGTLYGTGTTANAQASAAAGAGDTMDVTALVAGTAGNSIATTETLTNGSFGAATLTNGKNAEAANAVEIGASASDSIDNLVAAIVAGAGAGTLYGTGTTASTEVTAAAGAGDTMDVTAITAGAAGNSIATTETMTQGSFGAATLTGGDGAEAAYFVLVGATASDSIDNLVAAINGAAGAGTLYGTGTVAHPDVDAAAGAGDTMDLTASLGGVAGNSIATTETMTQGSFAAATLLGGVASNNLEAVAHGFDTGEGPFLLTSSGTLPSGLEEDTLYWIVKVDDDNFQVCTERSCVSPVTIGSDGTGTHTITKAGSEEAVFAQLRKHPAVVVAAATDIDNL